MKQFEKNHKWVGCPSCKEDWSKLKRCRFKWNGQWTEDNLCIQCAETTKSIGALLIRYPIPMLEMKKGFSGPSKATITSYCEACKEYHGGDHHPEECCCERQSETLWRNQYAILSLQNLKMVISATNPGSMIVIGEEDPKCFDNILACLSVAKEAADKFCDPKTLDSIGKKSHYR